MTANINQVCGVDGQTYVNLSVARCANVKVAYFGLCK